MLGKLRPRLEPVLDRIASVAHRAGLTSNALSFLAFASALASSLSYLHRWLLPAATLLLLSGAFDVLDGAVARRYGQETRLGAFLDSVLDRIADALILGTILLAGLCDLLWGLAALVASQLVSYLRAKGESLGLSMAGVGLAERAERMIVLALATLLTPLWAQALPIGVVLVALASILTVLQRIAFVCRRIS